MYFPGNLIGRLGSVIERNQTHNKIWSIELNRTFDLYRTVEIILNRTFDYQTPAWSLVIKLLLGEIRNLFEFVRFSV